MEDFKIENLSFTYPEASEKAINNVSLSIRQGEFVLLCGESGCGKSTLLRRLKKELASHGHQEGRIVYRGQALDTLSLADSAAQIGFVMQDPDTQLVCDKVYRELAFGLENLGVVTSEIRRRVAEIASFLGISHWFHASCDTLSGGQKQMLNLASVMVMQPQVLILDEPTSQLDPIAASEFMETLKKINRDLALTVILSEHRLEEAFCACDRVLIMQRGELICDSAPEHVAESLGNLGYDCAIAPGLPAAVRVFLALGAGGASPVSVKEGREWLFSNCCIEPELLPPEVQPSVGEAVLSMKEVWFSYARGDAAVLRGMDFYVKRGEIVGLLGGNGSGKTTALGVMCGNLKPYRGSITAFSRRRPRGGQPKTEGRICLLPQSPKALFVTDSVYDDLLRSGSEAAVKVVMEQLGITSLKSRHPYDLSGGELQKAALAKILLRRPELILLDEPTKGMDAACKNEFGLLLHKLAQGGAAIVLATHDVEFAAQYTTRCAMLFDGIIISGDTPRGFFGGNSYYTTGANRMVRSRCKQAITVEDVVAICQNSFTEKDSSFH